MDNAAQSVQPPEAAAICQYLQNTAVIYMYDKELSTCVVRWARFASPEWSGGTFCLERDTEGTGESMHRSNVKVCWISPGLPQFPAAEIVQRFSFALTKS
jgi:hypothetical protein